MVTQGTHDLLLFSIGPVQSFIAAARRTQDLWLGSQLLANLALVGVRQAEGEPGVSLIYPRKVAGEWPQNIPNRFVVAVPAGRGKELGKAITTATEEAWQGVADKVREFFAALAAENGWQDIWDRQVSGWLETYWVVWPWDGTDYGTAYRRASLALDARKQVRSFIPAAEPGETCTLCGLRQALHGKKDSRHQVRLFWELIRQDSRVGGMELKRGEHLCAICAVKRFAAHAGSKVSGQPLRIGRFPSTSSIAVTTFKAGLMNHWDVLQPLVEAHLDALDALTSQHVASYSQGSNLDIHTQNQDSMHRLLHRDGDFFYRESFSLEGLEDLLGRQPNSEDEVRAASALRTLNTLLKGTSEQGIAPPHSYLAVMALDGDNMGQLLSESESPAAHGTISDALVSFAQTKVRHIVEEEHGGRLVYTGGDDALALLPVDDVFSTADQLQRALKDALQENGWYDRSASAGVAIVHHTHSLESALQAARHAEHTAKESYGRNALVVEVLRRSGETTQIGLNWSYTDGPSDALSVIEQIRMYFAKHLLSGKFAYDLQDEAPALADLPDARQAELARLLRRHWQTKPEESRFEIESLARQLAELCESGRIEIEPLAEWLLVARFLAQGGGE